MSTDASVVVFVDLKDSTTKQQDQKKQYKKFLAEFLTVGEEFVARNKTSEGDRYVKNIGDAHMAVFRSIESAISFIVQLQQYYQYLSKSRYSFDVKLRACLALGAIQKIENDAFGEIVNLASRMQAHTKAGEISINKDLLKMLEQIWDKEELEKILVKEKQVDLRDIGKETLYFFDWESYGTDQPDNSLAGQIFDHLKDANVEMFNLDVTRLANPGLVIWPIVPRDLATAIHRGQAEIARLLTLLGWEINVVVNDCKRGGFEYGRMFAEKVSNHLTRRGLSAIEVQYMSNMYDPNYEHYSRLQSIFTDVSRHFTLENLLKLNEKSYDKGAIKKIRGRSALKFMDPILTSSVVLLLHKISEANNSIVLAGTDEEKQWDATLSLPSEERPRDYLAACLNPIYEKQDDQGTHQAFQGSDKPSWNSSNALLRDFKDSNLAWWVFCLHAFIPGFPSKHVEIGKKEFSPARWGGINEFPEGLSKKALSEHVWPLLDPNG